VGAVEQGRGTQTLKQHPSWIHAQTDRTTTGNTDKDRTHAVTPVVEQLAQRTARLRPPRLFPVDGVQRLVDEEAEGAGEGGPPGGHLGGRGAVHDQDQGRDDVHHQARHRDQVRGYPHGH